MICFVHIEKAARSTLHHILLHNYLHDFLATPHCWSNEEASELKANELKSIIMICPCIQVFGGHSTRHYLDYENALGKRIDYITFLREPYARYVSHYLH
ncbi:MAG: hypothetical protein ACYC0X_32910 [Pirellulaceae bacterium]